MADQQEVAQAFWDGLTPLEQEELRTSERPSGDVLRRMTHAGLLNVGARWESSDDPSYEFYLPPALRAIIEAEK